MFKGILVTVICSLIWVFTLSEVKASSLDVLRGRAAFNWFLDPKKTRCARVEKRLLHRSKSKDYTCDLTERNNSSWGEKFVKCTKNDNSAEYMVFKTMKSCEKERTAQAANK
jgi:hypothetical protein